MGLFRARLAGKTVLEPGRKIVDNALENGFADQAHLTRELRRWLGTTPRAMQQGADHWIDRFRHPDAFTKL
jgi:AraC-like DNA-binding protein